MQEAKKLIDEGMIGKVFHFRGFYLQDFAIDPGLPLSWRFQKDKAGSGSLGDIGSHTLDMALFLVGDIVSVSALTKTFVTERPKAGTAQDVLATKRDRSAALEMKGDVTVDDVTSFLMEFENGATGTLEATRFAYGRKNHLSFEINGDKGSLAFNWEHPAGEMLWPLAGFGLGYPETTLLMIHEFLQDIANNRKNSTDFDMGYKNCLVMDAVLESAEKGKQIHI